MSVERQDLIDNLALNSWQLLFQCPDHLPIHIASRFPINAADRLLSSGSYIGEQCAEWPGRSHVIHSLSNSPGRWSSFLGPLPCALWDCARINHILTIQCHGHWYVQTEAGHWGLGVFCFSQLLSRMVPSLTSQAPNMSLMFVKVGERGRASRRVFLGFKE